MKRTFTITIPRLMCACLFLVAILCQTTVSAGGLSGTYSINPAKKASASNYTSFNDADSDLVYGARASGGSANGPGVTGAVVFNAVAGTFEEQLYIPYISGVSATNSITFRGVDSASTILRNNIAGSYSSPGYVVELDNSSFINFDKIGIIHYGTPSGYNYDDVIIMWNVSDSNSFTNCQIVGNCPPGTSGQTALVYSAYNPSTYVYSSDNYNTFRNNAMKDGYFGFYWFGSYNASSAEVGTVIDHNTIDSIGYYGIYALYQDGISITNNKIHMAYGPMAIFMEIVDISYYGATTSSLVANNFISMANNGYSTTNYGIYEYYSDLTDIVYNNVNIYGGSGSYAAYIYTFTTTSGLNINNNNFINQNTGSGDYALYGYYWTAEDYNNLMTGGSNLVNYGGSNYADLTTWKTNSYGFGSNDVATNPIYISNTDLHVSNPLLNGTATPLSFVTTDIDGDTRNSTTPDIGADEFTPPALNPAVTAVTGPVAGFCAGTQNVVVNFTNLGLNTITSATIEWSVDGTAQTAYSWTGSLSSGATASITLGSYAFSSTSKAYSVVSYPSNANSTSISSTSSNTATTYIRAGMTGTYTIDNSGAGSPDYTSFRAAVSDLNLKGLCGSVTMKVANGYYNESIALNSLSGASATKTLTFIGDSNLTILDTAFTGTTLTMNGTSYTTFQKLFITNTGGSGQCNVVTMNSGASYNTFEGCLLESTPSSSNYGFVISNSYGSLEQYNTFYNNTITGGGYGVYMMGSGTTSGEMDNVFNHNTIDSNMYYGMFFEFEDSVAIINNNIFEPNGYGGIYSFYLIANGSGVDTTFIVNNMVTMQGPYAYGIYAYYTPLANIYYNSVNISSSASYYAAGYFYSYTSGTTNIVDNIFVNDAGGPAIYATPLAVTSMDYNDYYTSGSTLGNWNGTGCSTLANWQTNSGMDANSVSGDPAYNSTSTGDLHLTSGSSVVERVGTPVSITTDIDGDKRNPAPNMGADETKMFTLDAGVRSIDSPSVGFCAATKNVYCTIFNFGATTITSATVNWSVNGTTMTSVAWTGSIATGKTAMVKLGSVAFVSGSPKSVVAWTSAPNGGVDGNTSNDSHSKTIAASLTAGSYTIGGVSPDYNTFTDAGHALVNGVCGSVIFNVRDGYYNECLTLGIIPGSSTTNTVTFQSQSLNATKVILDSAWSTFSGRGYTLQLNGTNNVTFQYLTVSNYGSGSGYADVVEFMSQASYNTFNHDLLLSSTSGSNYGSVVYNPYGSNEEFNTVTHSQITGTYYPVYYNGSYNAPERGNILSYNLIDSASEFGIYMEYEDSLVIYGNTIDLTSNSSCYYGMYLYLYLSTATSDSSLIANNAVSMSSSYGYDVYMYSNNNYLNMVDNSFYSVAGSSYTVYMYSFSGTFNLMDNIFMNDNSGPAFYIYGGTYSDHNDWYTAGGTLGYWGGSSCATLTDLQSTNGMDNNSVSGDPMFNSPSTGDLHGTSSTAVIAKAGMPISYVTTDIDSQTRSTTTPDIGADEYTTLIPDDLGVSAILSPASKDCGSANTMVEVKIHNHGSNSENNYGVKVVVTAAGKTYTATRTKTNAIATSADDTAWFTMTPALNTSKGGTFYVKAYTTLSGDGNHTNDTDSAAIIMVAPPKASFTIAKTSICLGDTFKVKDASTFSGSATYAYTLVDSKGNTVATASTASPAITYSTAGSYRIKLTITASCSDTTSMACTINVNPTASFTYNKACAKDTTTFDGSASTAGTGATLSTYAWSFGDGNTASTVSPTNFYKNGTYPITVTFKVTNSFGCSNTATKSFNIDTLNASFTSKVAKDGTASFAANDKTFANYSWNYGDTSAIVSGSSTTSSYKYMKNNIYRSTLTVTNAAGCKNSWSTTDTVLVTGISEAVAGNFSMKIYPNPFKEMTNISYTLDNQNHVKVEVSDMLGRTVATLVDHVQTAGSYNVAFSATGNNASNGAGIYIVRMTIGDRVITKEISVIK